MDPAAPFRCTTSEMVAADSADGEDNTTSNSELMWIAVAAAATVPVIALVLTVVVTNRHRKGTAELEQDRRAFPPFQGHAESMHVLRHPSDRDISNVESSPSSFHDPV